MAIVLLVFFAALLLLSLWYLFRKPWIGPFLRACVAMGGIAFSVFGALLVWQYGEFATVESGKKLATVKSEALSKQRFRLSITVADGASTNYLVNGDAWQLDARIVYWDGWLSWLSPAPGLRFERVNGRYDSLQDEIERPRTVEAFDYQAQVFNSWGFLDRLGSIPGLRITNGTSIYVPMAHGASYSVYLEERGMRVMPDNEVAQKVLREWK